MTAPYAHGLLREQITTAPEEVECRHCGHWMHNHDGTGCTVVTGDTEWTVGVDVFCPCGARAAEVLATPEEPPPAVRHPYTPGRYINQPDQECGQSMGMDNLRIIRCGRTRSDPVHSGEVADERG